MITRECATLAAAVALSLAAGTGHAASPPQGLSVGERMVVVRLPDGTLMGGVHRSVDGVPEAAARYSSDNGATWSEPETILQLPAGMGLVEMLCDADGEVHLFLISDPGTGPVTQSEAERVLHNELINRRLDIWYSRSHDGRTRWEEPRMVWMGYTGALNSVIQMESGRILLPFSWWTPRSWGNRGGGIKDFTFVGQFDSTLIYSDDGGASWALANNLSIPVPDIVSAYGAVEPVVIQLKDGRVWMLIRGQTGRFWESFSDDGANWSEPQPTSIISSDSPAGIVRLDDGRIVLFWNNCLRFPYAYGGRQVLHAAVSDDEGKTWYGYREVARDPKRNEPPPTGGDFGTAYPFPATVNDGKVIYCTGQGEGRVLLMLLDPEWLLETSQTADFANRQEEWSIFGSKGVEFVERPDAPGAMALSLRKTEPDWPAGAVWNFPNGIEGRLTMALTINRRFKGALLGLTDHFSTPFDQEDRFANLFSLPIAPDGEILDGVRLRPGRSHELEFAWSCARRECRVSLDGREVGVLPLLRETAGVNYLRVRSVARGTDTGGLLLEAVDVHVANR